MNLDILATLITLGLSLSAALINAYKIYKKQVAPTLSTWLIFCSATCLSLSSYLSTENKNYLPAALNGADVFTDVLIILTIIFFSVTSWKIKPFEKYYLLGLIFIAGFWFYTKDAFHSNLLNQALLVLAYIPTLHNFIKIKRNTESFVVWGINLLSTAFSLYPTFNSWQQNGNYLAFIYSARSFVMISILMILMLKYSSKNNHLKPASF